MTNLEALKLVYRIRHTLLAANEALEIKSLENPDMAVSAPVAALISEFDVATNAIAARITALMTASTTLSAEDSAALQAEVDKLTALGKDPNNPVPTA